MEEESANSTPLHGEEDRGQTMTRTTADWQQIMEKSGPAGRDMHACGIEAAWTAKKATHVYIRVVSKKAQDESVFVVLSPDVEAANGGATFLSTGHIDETFAFYYYKEGGEVLCCQ